MVAPYISGEHDTGTRDAALLTVPRNLPFLVLLSALAGCAMAGPDDASGGGLEGKADESGGLHVAPELAPAYRMTVTSRVVTAETDGSEPTIFDSRIDGYVTPVATDGGLALEFQPCHIELPETGGRKPILADETVRGRGLIILPASFDEDVDGVLSLATETGALELGVALGDALIDALPTDEDDERLIDDDDDDETGVTIEVDGWKIYLAARALIWLAGEIDADTGVITGDADLTIDVQIYGDNIPFVNVRRNVEEAADDEGRSVIEVDNGFELAPLDDVPTSCTFLDVAPAQ